MVDSTPATGSPFDLRMAALSLTNNCNLRCRMCPVVQTDHFDNLSRTKAFEVADFLVRRKFQGLCVTGGEATLAPYFWEFMDYLRGTDLAITLLSNATRLKEERIARLTGWARLSVVVSIDGTQSVHDGIRGAGTFESSTRAIRAMTDSGIRVGVNTVIQRANFRTLPDLYEFFKPIPLAWHSFAYAEGRYENECLSLEELLASEAPLLDIMARSKTDGREVSLTPGMVRGFYLSERFPDIPLHPGKGCTVPQHGFHIDADGLFRPCWHYAWPFPADKWNINTRTLDDMVDSPEYRQAVLEAISGKCRGCSTLCYVWDEDFKRKVTEWPHRMERALPALYLKDFVRRRMPALFGMLKRVKTSTHPK